MPTNTLYSDMTTAQTSYELIASGGSGNGPLAESFTTGTLSPKITTIKLSLQDQANSSSVVDTGTITIALCSDSVGAPGTTITTLGTILESALHSNALPITVLTPHTQLTANTTYWIELTTSNASSQAAWAVTGSPSGTGVSGQSAYYNQSNQGTSSAFKMEVDGSTCFARGTRILTARGEVPVEALRPDDLAMALRAGRLAPVRWIGHRRVDLAAHPKPEAIDPIRIRTDSFADGVPSRDLIVSPDHAIFADGGLIAARYLLNGATIVQEAWPSVTYYHVELDAHDVLLADGLAAESYLDVGNRCSFANGGGVTTLHPDFDAGRAAAVWDAQACAPSLDKGEALTSLRRRLLDQAASLGHRRTGDPDLRLLARGQTIRPVRDGEEFRFDLPPEAGVIRLVSRCFSPKQMRAENADGRMLGVGVCTLALDDTPLGLDDARLLSGWHAPECVLRWTDGDASFDTGGARSLTLRLHADVSYWEEWPTEAPARARA